MSELPPVAMDEDCACTHSVRSKKLPEPVEEPDLLPHCTCALPAHGCSFGGALFSGGRRRLRRCRRWPGASRSITASIECAIGRNETNYAVSFSRTNVHPR